MAQEAEHAGLVPRPRAYAKAPDVTDEEATGAVHKINPLWVLLGTRRRQIPAGAHVHASVARRIKTEPGYAARLPSNVVFVDEDWTMPGRAR
jgi:hypothetical protein